MQIIKVSRLFSPVCLIFLVAAFGSIRAKDRTRSPAGKTRAANAQFAALNQRDTK